MRGKHRGMAQDRRAFFGAPAPDCLGEARVSDPMVTTHEGWQEASRKLVLPLRPGLEDAQPLAQAVVDALVVAGLEVQAGYGFGRTPVAPIQRLAAAQAQRACDRAGVAVGQEQHQLPRH